MDEKILEKVYKPARYLGIEHNVIKKDLGSVSMRFALCFPDLYEIGMSHLGFRIIYGLLNEIEGVACERVFMPDEDLECLLRKDNSGLTTLESGEPLSGFDVIGFSLSYELLFPNVLNILELSGIPLFSKDRSSKHPLIIAGGYSAVNPEPMADFIDCYFIGEAEETLPVVIDKIKSAKSKGTDRKELLRDLSLVQGIYVPGLWRVEYNSDKTIKSILPLNSSYPSKIKKCLVSDFNNSFFPERWLVPYMQIVHDRAIVEIMRGCPNKCKFCQARSVYYPYRVRKQERIIKLAQSQLLSSGYGEISLLGLSCGDHPQIEQVLGQLVSLCRDKGIGVSLPSLRIKDYIAGIPAILARIKKSGLTFAPEAASARLRKIIGKDIDIEQLLCVAENAYKSGYRRVKLYFMIGLPTETKDDLRKIVDLAASLAVKRKQLCGRLGEITLSISVFCPKPHTPFERRVMNNLEEIKEKQSFLRSYLCNSKDSGINFSTRRAVKIDFHYAQKSFVEAVLSRSGRKASALILTAFKLGARGDSGKHKFNFDIWKDALDKSETDASFYVNRNISQSEILPWAHIDLGAGVVA